MFDVLIKNAKVVDGTGNPWYFADVAVKGDKIVRVGKINGEARQIVDAAGLVLCPGFIDAHAHSDFTLFEHPTADSRVYQGITTEFGGHCGASPAPVVEEQRSEHKRTYDFLNINVPYTWSSMKEYLDFMEAQKPSVNFGSFIGNGSLRIGVGAIYDRPLTSEQLDKMRALARQAMKDGAFGLSAGFIYAPDFYTTKEEVSEVAKAVAEEDGIYTVHMRDERDHVLDSIHENIFVGTKAGIPVHISHHKVVYEKHWGSLSHATTALINITREKGIDVTADQYPYTSGATTLTTILPQWSLEGGLEELVKRLQTPKTRNEIRQEMIDQFGSESRDWNGVGILGAPHHPEYTGKTLVELGRMLDKEPVDVALDLFVEERGVVSSFVSTCGEEDIRIILQNRNVMIGTDGVASTLEAEGGIHPRSFGAFPRVIAKYCRELKLLELEDAIRKMTSLPANRMGLYDRGIIRPGMKADLVLFDFDRICDSPTIANPRQRCAGVLKVYVNGVLTVDDGRHTGARAGTVLRKGINT